jgi:hypothetical protein
MFAEKAGRYGLYVRGKGWTLRVLCSDKRQDVTGVNTEAFLESHEWQNTLKLPVTRSSELLRAWKDGQADGFHTIIVKIGIELIELQLVQPVPFILDSTSSFGRTLLDYKVTNSWLSRLHPLAFRLPIFHVPILLPTCRLPHHFVI